MDSPVPAPVTTDRRPLAWILLAAVLAYAPMLANGYVWDDIPLIVQNSVFAEPFDIRTALFTDLWAGASIGDEAASGYFRPLMVASLWLDHAVGGGAPGAHLHSLVWHLLVVVAGYRLGRTVAPEPVACAGALVLALHPLQTEAVMWVAARNDLMAAAFGLMALHATVSDKPRPVWAAVFTVLAAASKESVFLLPVAAGALWFAQPRPGGWRALLPRVAPVVAGLGAMVLLRWGLGVGGARGPTAQGFALLGSSLPSLLGWLGWKVAWPWPLSTGYALEYLDRLPLVARLGGGAALGLVVGVVGLRGTRLQRAALFWAALFLAPVAWALATTGWMGERYLYLSMLGVGWMLGSVFPAAGFGWKRPLVVVGLLWGIQVGLRSADWQTDTTLWASAHDHTPSPFTAESLGHALRGSAGPEASLPKFVEALDDPHPLSTSCSPLMRSAVGTRKMVRAVQLGHWAADRGCATDDFRGWQAIALASTGRWDRLDRWLEHSGVDPDGRLDIARATLALHRDDSATLDRLEERWSGVRPLRPQAEALLANARKVTGASPP